MNKELKVTINAVDNASSKLTQVGKAVTGVGKRVTDVGKTMSMALTAPIVAFGALSIKNLVGFQSEMNRVKGITGATGAEFKQLEKLAKELGQTTIFSARQSADAMGFLAMAGFKTKTIMEALPNVLELGASAAIDLADSADIVTNIMTGYGIETEKLGHVNDVLVTAFTSANTNLVQLGQAMTYAGPAAKAAGISFEETSAILGLMGNASIQSSMAGTSLRGGLVRLLNPTKETSDALGELGINVLDLVDGDGNIKDLSKLIADLSDKGATAGQVYRIFGQRAGTAFAALLGQGSEALTKLTDDLINSEGAAKRVSAVMLEGLPGALILLKSGFEGLTLTIGEHLEPMVRNLADGLTKLLSWFQELSPRTQGMVVVFAGLVAAAGPLLLMLGLLTQAIGALMSPLGLIIAAITVLAGGGLFSMLTSDGDDASSMFGNLWNKAQALYRQFMDSVRPAIDMLKQSFEILWNVIKTELLPTLQDFWANHGPQVTFLLKTIGVLVGVTVIGAINFLVVALQILIETFTGWLKIAESIYNFFKNLFNKEIDKVTLGFSLMTEAISATVDMYKKAWEWATKAYDSAKRFLGLDRGKSKSRKDVNDAVISPSGNIISTHPDDWLIATKNPGGLLSGGGNTVLNLTLTGNTFLGKEDIARQIGDTLMDQLNLRMKLS